MANDTDVVNLEPKIEGEIPEPKISGKPEGQPLDQASGSAVTLEAIEKLVKREVQSMKDSRLGKFDTRLDSLEGAIEKYEALLSQGLSKDQAKIKMQGDKELEDMKAQLASLLEGKAPEKSEGSGTRNWKEQQASILSEAGIEANDPRVIDMLKKENFPSHKDYLVALQERANEWSFEDAKKPQPSSSTVAQVTPPVIAKAGDFDQFSDDQLGDKLVELSKEPSKNQKEMDMLVAELSRRDAKKG